MLILNKSSKKITEQEFIDLEEIIKCKLPVAMKTLYLKYNGGQPNRLYVYDKNYGFPFNSFLSINEIKEELTWLDQSNIPNGFTPNNILPFAYDPGCGQFVLSLRKNDFGKVYFYILEEKAEIYGEWENFDIFLESFTNDDYDE